MIAVWRGAQIKGSRYYQEDRFAIVENNEILYRGASYPLPDQVFPMQWTLYVLADGMGGMGFGDVAASLVVEGFVESFINIDPASVSVGEHLLKALHEANERIADSIKMQPEKSGMGSTLIALLWKADEATLEWLSVGDSLLRLYRGGGWRDLNEKHTCIWLAQKKRELGLFEEAQFLEKQGVALCSALDGTVIPEIHQSLLPLQIESGDVVLLASDGLETLAPETLSEAVSHFVEVVPESSIPDLAKIAENLEVRVQEITDACFQQLKQAQPSDQDNATVVAIGFS